MKAVNWAILMLPLVLQASLGAEPFQHHDGNTQKLGIVVFPTSCSPAVQTDFQRAVALLHSFAYEDATLTFREIEKRDTTCGMAYWGEAMSYYHQMWEPPDAAHLEKGRESSKKPSPRVPKRSGSGTTLPQ